ncbi:MAG TPA: response regulator transcription factor [Candidatus Acidoferrales bacterium]|jgi:DNA-binding NarL/FixJ family response regulator|nr:response regulator transcription factor [Candidatus Acidoferrales bacterium]
MKLVLVDDQADFRSGLCDLLSSASGVDVVGEASEGREAVDVVLALRPDITLMDIRMPRMDGIAATAAIRSSWPDACVLVLTTFDEDALVRDAIQAGAAGYLLKGMPLAEMLSVFHLALRGYTTVGPRAGQPHAIAEGAAAAGDAAVRAAALSERERQIWSLLGEGRTNRDIAERLFITEGTVKNYVSVILSTLGVRHRTEAALLWRRTSEKA